MQRTIPAESEVLGWHTSLSNWGRWGPDDERGTLNLITAEKQVQAGRLVREGIAVSCARTITYDPTTDGPFPARHFMLRSGEGEPSETRGRVSTLDAFLLQPHGATMTHLDAPSHTIVRTDPSKPWTMYNGKPRELVKTVEGATAGSIELAGSGIVSRGVLLDVAAVRSKEWLESTEPVFPEDLDAAEAKHGVHVEPGDVLFVRTGWALRRKRLGPPRPEDGTCALQAACLPWLRERDIALLGTDTSNDVSPTEYPGLGRSGAIHGVGMGAIGLWILDNADFEELAATCTWLGRWEFQAVIAPLKLEHGTCSPVNPLAIF